jgi:hypothetical protein
MKTRHLRLGIVTFACLIALSVAWTQAALGRAEPVARLKARVAKVKGAKEYEQCIVEPVQFCLPPEVITFLLFPKTKTWEIKEDEEVGGTYYKSGKYTHLVYRSGEAREIVLTKSHGNYRGPYIDNGKTIEVIELRKL